MGNSQVWVQLERFAERFACAIVGQRGSVVVIRERVVRLQLGKPRHPLLVALCLSDLLCLHLSQIKIRFRVSRN